MLRWQEASGGSAVDAYIISICLFKEANLFQNGEEKNTYDREQNQSKPRHA